MYDCTSIAQFNKHAKFEEIVKVKMNREYI